MKKGIFILVVGLALAAAAYGCIYFVCTSSARNLERSSQPELAWLKEEFHLSDSEFKRISELHASYLPQCAERCRQIAAQNQRVKALLAATNQMTPEIESAIAESARLRVNASATCSGIFTKSAARCRQNKDAGIWPGCRKEHS